MKLKYAYHTVYCMVLFSLISILSGLIEGTPFLHLMFSILSFVFFGIRYCLPLKTELLQTGILLTAYGTMLSGDPILLRCI